MHHLKLLLKVIFVMNLINKYAALKVEDCGITKNCISNPSECSQTDASCQIFTYVYVSRIDKIFDNLITTFFAVQLTFVSGFRIQFDTIMLRFNDIFLESSR